MLQNANIFKIGLFSIPEPIIEKVCKKHPNLISECCLLINSPTFDKNIKPTIHDLLLLMNFQRLCFDHTQHLLAGIQEDSVYIVSRFLIKNNLVEKCITNKSYSVLKYLIEKQFSTTIFAERTDELNQDADYKSFNLAEYAAFTGDYKLMKFCVENKELIKFGKNLAAELPSSPEKFETEFRISFGNTLSFALHSNNALLLDLVLSCYKSDEIDTIDKFQAKKILDYGECCAGVILKWQDKLKLS